jgi:hypothetical protein
MRPVVLPPSGNPISRSAAAGRDLHLPREIEHVGREP